MDRIIVKKSILNCSTEQVFKLFTENQALETWLTEKADVEPKVHGKYELYWNPDKPEENSTIGCRILDIESPYYLNFEWKGPPQFAAEMNKLRPLTNVTVFFSPRDNGTQSTLIHTGWGDSKEWEEARQFFIHAWDRAFSRLEEYTQ